MSGNTIKCPNCGTEIELTEVLTRQIEDSIKAKYVAETAEKEREIADKVLSLKKQEEELQKGRESIACEVEERLKSERSKISEQKKALEVQRQQIDEQVSERLRNERKVIAEKERRRILAEQADEKAALAEELEEKNKKLQEANQKELELRKAQRQLEEKSERLELEVERKLNEERKKIGVEARRQAEEEQHLKLREKDDLVVSLKSQLEDMRRKMEQGSQERQGEMLEEELKELLERNFPFDRFEDVPKGKRGADIVQVVHGPTGKVCGKILWESKNTKEFSKGWIEKLKKDQADAGAEFSILMTVAMPREVRDFDFYNDIWVTNYKCAIGLCTSLRHGLINVARERVVAAGQESMKDVVYKYVTGQEFSRRIKRIVDAYVQMQTDLESEKRAMTKIWKKREKQISVVLDNAAEMRGEIEGLVGGKMELPEAGMLELDSIAGDID